VTPMRPDREPLGRRSDLQRLRPLRADFVPITRAERTVLGIITANYRGERLWCWVGPNMMCLVQYRRVISSVDVDVTLGELLCSPVPRVTTPRVSITLSNFQSRLV
jgi:hypothetical protein